MEVVIVLTVMVAIMSLHQSCFAGLFRIHLANLKIQSSKLVKILFPDDLEYSYSSIYKVFSLFYTTLQSKSCFESFH